MILFLYLWNNDVLGQLHHQMLSAQGGSNTTQSGVLVSQTIGQTSVIGAYFNQTVKVGQGFQQAVFGRLQIEGHEPGLSPLVFPNPFENQITIRYLVQEVLKVTIFDMTGKQLYQNKLSFVSENKTIDVRFFSPGVYLVRLESKQNTNYSKIVKR
jgi:hypothetical protein